MASTQKNTRLKELLSKWKNGVVYFPTGYPKMAAHFCSNKS